MTATCLAAWELEDPSPEDRAAGRVHCCALPDTHAGHHRCRCGHVIGTFELALIDALSPTEETP